MHWLTMPTWSPYLVGAGIGVLSWITFLISDRALGCSTSCSQTSGLLERLLLGKKALQKTYYQQVVPNIDWGWMLVLGVVIGAFLSSRLSGEFNVEWVPSLWAAEFGTSPLARWLAALLGGILMGLGARWADGCTSGHGISGTLQLAASSWLAVIGFFAGGIAMALFIFRIIGGEG